MIELPIADGFYRSSSLPIDSQRCVNAYPVITETPNFTRHSLFGTPGISEVADVSSGSCRGSLEMAGIPYFVIGQKLYRLNRVVVNSADTFTTTDLGSIGGVGRVSMAQNGTQLMILVPGSTGYIYNRNSGSLAAISDADFTANGNPQHVRFIDGYFVCSTDEKKFLVSALNDGTSWDALDFGSSEADPDDIVAPAVLNGRLFMLGTETIQPFQNIGGADFPFQSVPAAIIPKGCYAAFSVIEANNTFCFVGGGENEDPAIWACNGQEPIKLSNEGIDYLLNQLSDAELSGVYAWNYAEQGASFVGFTLRDTTVVYDFSTGLWHERRTRVYDSKGYALESRWRANAIVRAYGRTFVGDNASAKIGEASLSYYDEYGLEILRYAVSQPFENQGDAFRIAKLEATTESGAANATEADPKIRLSLSKNGIDFGPERGRSIGKVGQRNLRQIWRKNGRFSRRSAIRIAMSDKVRFVLVKLEALFS